MKVRLNLWVENQDVAGANCDETHGYLAAAKWSGEQVVTVDVAGLGEWFAAVFLPLRNAVAEAGWGVDADDLEVSPSLVCQVDADLNYTPALQSLLMMACAEEDSAEFVRVVLSAMKQADYQLAFSN